MLAKIVLTVFCLTFLGPLIMTAQEPAEIQLSDYKWQNRLLLIFARSQNYSINKK